LQDTSCEDNKVSRFKNILSILLLAVIVFVVSGVSFKAGEEIYFTYKKTVKDSIQKDVPLNSKYRPVVDPVPKSDEASGEAIIEVKESAPTIMIESFSGQVKKMDGPVTEKKMVLPVQKVVAPIARKEKPAASVNREETAPEVQPEAINSAVRPAIKERKPVAKRKVAAANKPETPKQYKIVAGSFSVKANADNLISQLEANHYEPLIVQAETPKGQLYRVTVGSYGSFSLIKTKIGELKKMGCQAFYIVE
jgi:cell division septation protein DedD